MRQSWRRLRRTFGWLGMTNLVIAIPVLAYLAINGFGGLSPSAWNVFRPVYGTLVLLTVTAGAWGRYQRSAKITDQSEVVPQLVTSRTEFALLLRPFGSDGEELVPQTPGRWQRILWAAPWMTIEQVVTTSVRDVLGMDTYAMVDTDQVLAPPGPVYVRTSHTQWRAPVRALIRRAHTIVLMLPPGQGLRPALEWEIAEIVAARRQSRVVLVLPPTQRAEDIDGLYRQAGAVLMALTRRRPLGSVTQAESDTGAAPLPPDTLLVGLRRDGPGHTPSPWYREPDPKQRPSATGRPHLIATAEIYHDALSKELQAQVADWSTTPFDRRYPWYAELMGPEPARRESEGSS